MRKIKTVLFFVSMLTILSFKSINAEDFSFTGSEVAKHNTESNCYVIFDGNVYDLTTYLKLHDRYLDIRDWCGTDMTEAFQTKDGTNRDHKSSSYALLENYRIGKLSTVKATNTAIPSQEQENPAATIIVTQAVENKVDISTSPVETKNPYVLLPLVLITGLLYWGWYVLTKRGYKSKLFTLPVFNLFWNSVLLITLIPSFFFGVLMIMQYSIPALNDIDFNFIYWHVEGSIIMGTVALCHFINRIKQYFFQAKFIGSPQS